MTACAVVMALGTALGGYHVIRTLGMSLAHLRPINGFAAETSATAVLMGAAAFGVPVSTTQVITASIMGVGATRRLSAVRWSIGEKILYAWIFTFPACALMGALLSWLLGSRGLLASN
jgi:PiT family inorganic phosphate transporter